MVGAAAVMEPRLEVDEYLELARFFETRNHADRVSGTAG
jgi:hypothetical protein